MARQATVKPRGSGLDHKNHDEVLLSRTDHGVGPCGLPRTYGAASTHRGA